ncbi:MAG: transglycosylase domain-containing protein, partial [Candidatus Xenobia bacterium]
NQFNRAWQAQRQPGSAFKIFVYSAALEDGYTPDSSITDAPFAIRVNSADVYAPHNSDQRYWGTMPIRRALQYSRDIPALRMINQIGIQQVIDTANRLGIEEHLEPVLPLALGAADLTPLELASAVSTLPDLGTHVEPTCIKKVFDANGHVLEDNTHPYRERVLSEQTAYAMDEMLQNVIAAGTGTAAQIDRPAAGKTGTTDDFRDAWFVGFTPDLLAAVWSGNDDYSPTLHGFGGTISAPIWHDFMLPALAGRPKRQFGVTRHGKIGVLMCTDSHERAAATCPHVKRMFFAPDKVPQKWCTVHTLHAVTTPMAVVNYGTFSTTPSVRLHDQPVVAAVPVAHPEPVRRYSTWHRPRSVAPTLTPHAASTPIPLTVVPPPPPPPPNVQPVQASLPPSPPPHARKPRRYVDTTPATPWVNPANDQRSRQDEDFNFDRPH